MKRTRRTCPEGHTYYKSSDCPTCPICEVAARPSEGFLSRLPAPARRALENAGLTALNDLAQKTEQEILSLHGMGKASIPTLKSVLAEAGLNFK